MGAPKKLITVALIRINHCDEIRKINATLDSGDHFRPIIKKIQNWTYDGVTAELIRVSRNGRLIYREVCNG